MNMKKIKKFFTLSRRAEGFTLVELIVVIAILAILGGVAVPAYSGYIKKAHMAADQTMISDVAKALQLQYYSNPNAATATYVILTSEGAITTDGQLDAEGKPQVGFVKGGPIMMSATAGAAEEASTVFADKAMTGVFGSNWRETLKLESNEWGLEEGVMEVVNGYTPAQIEAIANSTFANQAATQGMLDTVTKLTGMVDTAVANAGGDKADKLARLLGPDSSVVKGLEASGLTPSDPGYSTAVSNLLVGYFANEISTGETNGGYLGELCTLYATAYAYSEATNDPSAMNAIDAYISGLDYESLNTSHLDALSTNPAIIAMAGSGYAENGQIDTDTAAFLAMMGAVSEYSNGYTDKADLTNPGLYGSEAVASQLSGFMGAVKAMYELDAQELITNLPTGTVAVLISSDGSVSVVPEDAWAA